MHGPIAVAEGKNAQTVGVNYGQSVEAGEPRHLLLPIANSFNSSLPRKV